MYILEYDGEKQAIIETFVSLHDTYTRLLALQAINGQHMFYAVYKGTLLEKENG